MIYSIDELRQMVAPIAAKYNLPAVYVFGSYARNEATEDSDIDVLIDRTGSAVRSLFDMGRLHEDLRACFNKEVDLVTTAALMQEESRRKTPWFTETVMEERIVLYARE